MSELVKVCGKYLLKRCPLCCNVPDVDDKAYQFTIRCRCGLSLTKKHEGDNSEYLAAVEKALSQWNAFCSENNAPVLLVESGSVDEEKAEALGFRVLTYKQGAQTPIIYGRGASNE